MSDGFYVPEERIFTDNDRKILEQFKTERIITTEEETRILKHASDYSCINYGFNWTLMKQTAKLSPDARIYR